MAFSLSLLAMEICPTPSGTSSPQCFRPAVRTKRLLFVLAPSVFAEASKRWFPIAMGRPLFKDQCQRANASPSWTVLAISTLSEDDNINCVGPCGKIKGAHDGGDLAWWGSDLHTVGRNTWWFAVLFTITRHAVHGWGSIAVAMRAHSRSRFEDAQYRVQLIEWWSVDGSQLYLVNLLSWPPAKRWLLRSFQWKPH